MRALGPLGVGTAVKSNPRNSSSPLKRTPAIVGAIALFALLGSLLLAQPASAADDSAFTIAQVPDTQNEVLNSTTPLLTNRYAWLAANKSALNLKFIAHTGDLVNWGAVDPAQFQRADEATKILDQSGVPYGYAIGNHDSAAVTTGGSAAPGDTRVNLRNTAEFNKFFPPSRFKNLAGLYETGRSDNMFQTFKAGGADWLVITHEMWPRQSVIDWMKYVVQTHPNHNVIVSTHAFIDGAGGLPTTGNYGDVNAASEWDQFLSRYSNIKIVLSGHYGPSANSIGAYYAQRTGVNGNQVNVVMTAYHSPWQNHVRLLKVDTSTMTLQSSIFVERSINTNYPSGYIHDAYSDFAATGVNFQPSDLLPDPGFESGTSGWSPFLVGTLTRVQSPVRTGSGALRVAVPANPTSTLVGITNNNSVVNSVAGARYVASCWAKSSVAGRSVRMDLHEYSSDYTAHVKLVSGSKVALSTDFWTQIQVAGVATTSGRRIIPQVFSTDQKRRDTITYDDCSLTIAPLDGAAASPAIAAPAQDSPTDTTAADSRATDLELAVLRSALPG